MLQLGTLFTRNAALLARAIAAAYAAETERGELLADIEHDHVTEIFGAIPTDSGLIFRSGDATVLALRGSPSPVDANGPRVWFSNLDIQKMSWAKGRVHAQFAQAASVLFDQAVAMLGTSEFAGRPLFIAGHSRGAALATLVARRLVDSPPFSDQPPFLYCFASPRVGDGDFYLDFQSCPLTANTYLFVNSGDPVPHVPPTRTGFFHVENQWLLGPRAGGIEYGDIDTSQTGASTFRFALGTLGSLLRGEFSAADLRTHSLTSYMARIDQAI